MLLRALEGAGEEVGMGGRGKTRGDGEVKRGGIDRIEKLKRIT